jgi:hypothetical protein
VGSSTANYNGYTDRERNNEREEIIEEIIVGDRQLQRLHLQKMKINLQTLIVEKIIEEMQIPKSTKGAENFKKVLEMRNIWENKKLEKIKIRPENSANKPFCVKSMRGGRLPTN